MNLKQLNYLINQKITRTIKNLNYYRQEISSFFNEEMMLKISHNQLAFRFFKLKVQKTINNMS